MTEGTNLLVLTISAFWSSSRWPRAMSSRKQRSIPLGGRYRQVALYNIKDLVLRPFIQIIPYQTTGNFIELLIPNFVKGSCD